ncbi:iron chelate uptake ABC transporter family permease subunit [Paracoccus sp. JM45]|uniref:FecCD family ABC transporter permease n=1 Tax=Paracoccus sp. JM45 TaxID=2283626 RepID=UPI000E6CFED8|nr:iron ABC transporter permease [Paracoccus sp. JM45]
MDSTIAKLRLSQQRRQMQYRTIITALLASLTVVFALSLMLGQSFTPPMDVLHVLLGHEVPDASFTVGHLRLPRAVLAVLAGFSFGLGGAAFQIMLRNPLASPDIIGINAGASAAAVFAIVVLSMNGPMVAISAIVAGLAIAALIFGLSFSNGIAGARLILVGIGVSSMLDSAIAYFLAQAPAWDLQQAMRWLTGSLNGATMQQATWLAMALVVFGGILMTRLRDLDMLRLGDDTAAALGTDVARTRLVVTMSAVGIIAVATAVTGPIAFVAFLSGPIAARIVGARGSVLIPAALVGALLVLAGDYAGQFLLPGRYPVGVVTGAIGAPYLIFLIIRANKNGAT